MTTVTNPQESDDKAALHKRQLTDKERAAIEKTLGEPVMSPFNDRAERFRRNLIVVSFVMIGYKLSGATLETFEPFGLRFSHIDLSSIDLLLILLGAYQVVNFLWVSADTMMELRNRITGTRLAFVTVGKFSGEHGDYPDDPRQSSLMTWWKHEEPKIGALGNMADTVIAKIDAADAVLKEKDAGTLPNLNNFHQALGGVKNDLMALRRQVEDAEKTFKSQRIPVSLERYERWFRVFAWSQIARAAILDFLVPLGLFVAGVIILLIM